MQGKIYAVGGYNTHDGGASSALQSVEVYDIATGVWDSMQPLSVPRKFHSACALDGRVFVFGGQSRDKDNLKSSEVFDPAASSQSWEPFVDMRTIRVEFGICTSGDCIFIAGAFQPSR